MKMLPKIVLIAAVLFLLWLPYFLYNLGPVEEQSQRLREFSIEKGAGLAEIAANLESQGFVRSSSLFKLYNFFKGSAHQLKPGLYLLSRSYNAKTIVELLTEGPDNKVNVVIFEGKTVDQIDLRLSQLGILKRGEISNFPLDELSDNGDFSFLDGKDSLEGFLFPDTYEFSLDDSAKDVIEKMLTAFKEKALDIIQLSGKDFYESLIIASIIEREVPDSQERREVSSVIQNRLAIDMPLQIDATLIYAKDHGSAYDSYENRGLPPTPISNPGLDAIKAAISPANTDYYYYLSRPDTKETLFSTTFEEHDEKRAKYLR